MISLLLIIIAAAANAIGDKIQFHWSRSVFANQGWDAWANPTFSWRRKWKINQFGVERFPGSSTLFVWTTDLWHLMKFVQLNSLFLALVTYEPLINSSSSVWSHAVSFVILRVTYGIVFEILFSKLLQRT